MVNELTDSRGNRLVGIEAISETGLLEHAQRVACPLSLVVVVGPEGVLFGLNRWRSQWELPGGMIGAGETAREAARRELLEETGLDANRLEFVGVATFDLVTPDRRELAAIFTTSHDGHGDFVANDELVDFRWLAPDEDSPGSAALDVAIARWACKQL